MVWVFQQVPGSGITLSIWGVLRSVSFAGGAMHAPWRAAEQLGPDSQLLGLFEMWVG